MELHKASTLAINLMNKHNLWGWNFEWNNRKRAFGLCSHRKKTIFLSKILIVQVDEIGVTNTILHEIVHALVGAGQGHNSIWRNKAIEIGCNGQRCSNHNTNIEAKYVATCDCGVVHNAHRKPKVSHWCKCKGRRFNPLESLRYVQMF